MSTSNPFRRKMAEERDRSARSSLEGSRTSTLSSGDEFTPSQSSGTTASSVTIPESAIIPPSSTNPPRIPPPVSPQISKRRSLPPPPPPSRSASRRVSTSIEPRTSPPSPPPPPPPPVAIVEPEDDPFEQASEESDSDDRDTSESEEEQEGKLSVVIPPPPPPMPRSPPPKSSPGGLNPFRKSGDPGPNKRQSFDITSIRFGPGATDNIEEFEVPRALPRQSLDVDAFKRLILTGRADPIEDFSSGDSRVKSSISLEAQAPSGIFGDELSKTDDEIEARSDVERVRTNSNSEPSPAGQYEAIPLMIKADTIQSDVTTPAPTPSTAPPAKVKPLPPRPRIRPSGSPHSGSSSSIQQLTSPTSSSTTPLATPIPTTPGSYPPLAISSTVPTDYISGRQSPLPTSAVEDRSPIQASAPSTPNFKKPLPPSPPLSRKDSTRRSTLSPPSMAAGPPGGLSRSNSTNRRPPPPPARRTHPNSSTVPPIPTSATTASPSQAEIPTPMLDNLPASNKPFSPPPPPPRGTRRKGPTVEPIVSPLSRIPSPIPILHPGPGIDRLPGEDVISTEPITPGLNPDLGEGRKHEEDILADLESLQREVDKLKGMVESRNGIAL